MTRYTLRGGAWYLGLQPCSAWSDTAVPPTARSYGISFRPIIAGPLYNVLMGGSWYDIPRYCRSAAHNNLMRSGRYHGGGLRFILLPSTRSLPCARRH